jgi:hypothetical protein
MWTRSDWRHLSASPRPSLKSITFFLILIFTALSYLTSNLFFLIGCLLTLFFYIFFPRPLIFFNEAWFILGLISSWLFQPIFLLLIYFFVFVPFGIVLKVISKKNNSGHWVKKEKPCQFDKAF